MKSIMDERSWELFFKRNKYLTTMELAQKVGVSTITIQKWKRRLGLLDEGDGWGSNLKKRPFKGVKPPRKYDGPVVPMEVWNNEKWMRKMYEEKGYGIRTIARMINRDVARVRHKLIRFGIPIRSFHEATKSKNKCCNRKWLEENYVAQGLPIEKCAEIAGVCPYTIYNWLVKFCIPMRDKYDCSAGERNPNYGKVPPALAKYHQKRS